MLYYDLMEPLGSRVGSRVHRSYGVELTYNF